MAKKWKKSSNKKKNEEAKPRRVWPTWGVDPSQAVYASNWECQTQGCDTEGRAEIMVGFSTDGAYSSSLGLGYKEGIAVYECPTCFAYFKYHVVKEILEYAESHCPRWPK